LSQDIKIGGLPVLARITEPDDLEAQTEALRRLQPGIMEAGPASSRKSGFFTAFKTKIAQLIRSFIQV
jgi:hypothetical protein